MEIVIPCKICEDSAGTVVCPWCDFVSCTKCGRRIIEESINPPACCHCRKGWTDEFVSTSLGSHWFHSKYRTSRAHVLLDRQRAMFAATMPDVEIAQRKRNFETATKKLNEERCVLKKRMNAIRDEMLALSAHTLSLRPRPARTEHSFRCATPECRGFVTESSRQCVVCGGETCWTCLSAIGTAAPDRVHECHPDAVLSAREVRRSTVSCPGCKTRIQRSSGCDQMFCVVCHVAFSYRTGERENGAIHNPHYVALLNQLGQHVPHQPGPHVGECAGAEGAFPSVMRWMISSTTRRGLLGRVRVFHHITAVELRRITTVADPMQRHRVRYLMGDITEARLASLIKRTDFDVKIKEHYAAMFRAFLETSRGVFDRMNHVVDKVLPRDRNGNAAEDAVELAKIAANDAKIQPMVNELDQIIQISNTASKEVGELYKRQYFVIPTRYTNDFVSEVKWVGFK